MNDMPRMLPNRSACRTFVFLFALLATGKPAWAQPVATPKTDGDHVLTPEKSVARCLRDNPELAVFRQQRGVANAAVVIARTYPFNPIFTGAVLPDGGPAAAGILNRVATVFTLSQEMEWRGQSKIRQQVAAATLSRVEWDIAAKEQQIAVQTIRAFYAYVYFYEKLRLADETIRVQQQTTAKVQRLVEQGKLRAADLLLARSDEMETRAQRRPRQVQATIAWHDLLRLLGTREDIFSVQGRLTTATSVGTAEQWLPFALDRRADLKAVELAYVEAEQRENLQIADRFGNPQFGVKSEVNETAVFFLGPTISVALPFNNTKVGEIQQRRAEKIKVLLEKERVQSDIRRDVAAALDRLGEANKSVQLFDGDILPGLRKTMEAFDQLFAQGEPSVDVLRLIDVHRRYLRASDGYLDAFWELSQARAGLAAAVGDFAFALEGRDASAQLGPPE